jgi:signal transduction histidine kinase/Na+/proline symporter
MSAWLLGFISLAFLGLLFFIASRVENRSLFRTRIADSPFTYALSLGVYCTAWTFYGSVGRAATAGPDFLAIYIGPMLTIPLWWLVMRKIIRISKLQNISTLADFISSRYGKDPWLAGFIALSCLIGIIPYISLQIKAISDSFSIIALPSIQSVSASWTSGIPWPSLLFTIIIGAFSIRYGTRTLESNKPRSGMMTAIAVESVVKLVAFMVVGIIVLWGLHSGPGSLFSEASAKLPDYQRLVTFPEKGYMDWFFLCLISGLAIFLLPRQFQVTVIENKAESHLRTAMWVFPLYLFLINLFVVPVAISGRLLFADQPVNPDTYLLSLTQLTGWDWLSLIAYLGGFSAASAMMVISSIALSTMLSNNVIIPLILRFGRYTADKDTRYTGLLINSRRFSIMLILFLAYLYFLYFTQDTPLVSIGITSFIAVSQFAPALLIGLYWKGANRVGAYLGIAVGLLIWFYSLILPVLLAKGHFLWSAEAWHAGQNIAPYSLIAIPGFNHISEVIFWSLLLNTFFFVMGSLIFKPSQMEHSQATLYVHAFRYSTSYENTVQWGGTAAFPDVKSLLIRFLGNRRTEDVLDRYARRNNLDWKARPNLDSRAIAYAERLLAETIGPASARIMVASVVKDVEIGIKEVVDILKESQEVIELNKALTLKSEQLSKASNELKAANERLKQYGELKDEFLYTVTHELRTPITSIRAMAELVYDHPEMDDLEKERFLSTIILECERLTRLISNVLDLEKFESGNMELSLAKDDVKTIIEESINASRQLAETKSVKLHFDVRSGLPEVWIDRDRITQVLINLLSNAIKFVKPKEGEVRVTAYRLDQYLTVNVSDNGPGISKEEQQRLFDKFYQAKNQTRKKPEGSGLGLAICKSIIEMHQGRIWVESEEGHGARFVFTLPLNDAYTLPQPKQSAI